jgi:hypothetical protein
MMESAHARGNASPVLQEGKVIYILGPIQLQNSLMASFLEEAVGAKCFAIETISNLGKSEDDDAQERKLVLWDCFGKNMQDFLLEYKANAQQISFVDSVALFNLSQGIGIEERKIRLKKWQRGLKPFSRVNCGSRGVSCRGTSRTRTMRNLL